MVHRFSYRTIRNITRLKSVSFDNCIKSYNISLQEAYIEKMVHKVLSLAVDNTLTKFHQIMSSSEKVIRFLADVVPPP